MHNKHTGELTINGFRKPARAPLNGDCTHWFRVTVRFDSGEQDLSLGANTIEDAQDLAARTWGERNVYNFRQIF